MRTFGELLKEEVRDKCAPYARCRGHSVRRRGSKETWLTHFPGGIGCRGAVTLFFCLFFMNLAFRERLSVWLSFADAFRFNILRPTDYRASAHANVTIWGPRMSKPVFEDLFTFSGRRNRKSYLLYVLAVFCVWMLLAVLFVIPAVNNSDAGVGVVGIISIIVLIATVVSNWAVGGQRCRDFGWTAWAVLITAIPYLGLLFAIAIMVVPGSVGDNRYGPDPISKG